MNYVSILFLGLVASQCSAVPVPESSDLIARQMPPMGPIVPLAKMSYARQEPVEPVLPVALSGDERAILGKVYARQVAPWAVSAVASDNKPPIAARQVQLLERVAATKAEADLLPVAVAGKLATRQEPRGPVNPLTDPVQPLSSVLPVSPVATDLDATAKLAVRQNPVEPVQPLGRFSEDAEGRAKAVARQVDPVQPRPLSADDADALGRFAVARQEPVQPVQLSEEEFAVLARILTRQLNPVAVNAPTESEESFVRTKGL